MNKPVFAVSVDFEQVDACLEAGRACAALAGGRGDVAGPRAGAAEQRGGSAPAMLVDDSTRAWEKTLSLAGSRGILAQAKVEPSELADLIVSGYLGEDLPEDMRGFLAKKALRCAEGPRFARFVEEVRAGAGAIAGAAARAAEAYLPALPGSSLLPVTVRFAGFALADAFSPPGGPVINLGDLFFLVHEKIAGSEQDRSAKTLRLVRRLIAHELHHLGFGRLARFPEAPNAEWLLTFIISEGVATALILPFTEDDAYYYDRWTQHSGRLERYVWDLSDALAMSQERIPQDVWEKWVMNVGAAYYVGASMTQAIDRAFGRERLLEAVAGGAPIFFRVYNSAAAKWRLPALIGVGE